MAERIRVEGAERLAATLAGASVALGDLTGPSKASGSLILSRARGAAPRRSGRLSGSLVATPARDGVAVGSGLIYAPVIHWGWPGHGIAPNPFLTRSAEATQPQTIAAFRTYIGTVLKGVKGK